MASTNMKTCISTRICFIYININGSTWK